MILLLDNYDSFTYNIVQYLEHLGAHVQVFKTDKISMADIEALYTAHKIQAIILGPGPGTPDDAGITLECIKQFAGRIPMLGVCLGHQAIAQAFGAKIVKAKNIMHGRTSKVYHDAQGVFSGIDNPTLVTRYHSLLVDKVTLPDTLKIIAWTKDLTALNSNENTNEIMGIRHQQLPIIGVQFHPESILSKAGLQLFKNFLDAHTIGCLKPFSN